MAKKVETHTAKLKSVESNGVKAEDEWRWRRSFIGMVGTLTIYKSEHTTDKYICVMVGWEGYLKTGKGDITRLRNELSISTKNSIYTFILYDNSLQSSVNENYDRYSEIWPNIG